MGLGLCGRSRRHRARDPRQRRRREGTTRETDGRFRGFRARIPNDANRVLVLGALSGAQGPDICRINTKAGKMTVEVENPGWVRRWFLDPT